MWHKTAAVVYNNPMNDETVNSINTDTGAPSFEWFEAKARELLTKLPEEFFNGLNGGVVVEEGERLSEFAEDGDLYVLGIYMRSSGTGKQIRLYYGSFLKVVPHSEAAFEKQLWKTIRHEFRHHLETKAGIRDLEIEDREFIAGHMAKRKGGS